MSKEEIWYTVSPDSVRMGLADENKQMAMFRDERQARLFANDMWGEYHTIEEVPLPTRDVEDSEKVKEIALAVHNDLLFYGEIKMATRWKIMKVVNPELEKMSQRIESDSN